MPPPAYTASTISVRETLDLLGGPFKAFALAFDHGEYAVWLGSGISRERVAALDGVLSKLLEFVRTRVTGAPTCAYRLALDAILNIAALSPQEKARVNYATPVGRWPDIKIILLRLSQNYSDVLNVTVRGKQSDYLLWEAADFVNTFANQEPDVEHLCIGMLALEGVATELVTANWDGLLEAAIQELGYQIDFYRICVRGDDFRGPAAATKLLKFHGCALRAISEEAVYRPLLIARAPQIIDWGANPDFAAIRQHMTNVAAQLRTLMIGMSAQDKNIQILFGVAKGLNAWKWTDAAPPHVFAEDTIGIGQRVILQVSYGNDFDRNEVAILERSRIQAYGKPLLIALVLNTLCSKCCALLAMAGAPTLTAADYAALNSVVLRLRDLAAVQAEIEPLVFVRRLARHFSRAKTILQDGRCPTSATVPYRSISTRPAHQMVNDPNLRITGQSEAACGLALIGLGEISNHWSITLNDLSDDKGGTLRLTSASGTARIIMVANDNVALQLFDGGVYDESDGDAILLHSSHIRVARQRAPSRSLGRKGKKSAGHIDIEDLLQQSSGLSDLQTRFRQRIGI